MRSLATILLALFTLIPSPARAQTSARSLALHEWLDGASISSMTLSPDGKWVAGMGTRNWGTAFVMSVDDPKLQVIAQRFDDNRHRFGLWPIAVHWINNDLLAVDLSDRQSIAVDRTGKRVTELGERFIRRMTEKGVATDDVLVYRDIEQGDIDLVNARTGQRRRYDIALPGKVAYTAFDASGALRAVTMMDTAFWTAKTKLSNWYRESEQSAWQLLAETPVSEEQWRPLRALQEPSSLAVLSRDGRDTYAVFRYDTSKRQVMEMMAGHPHEDIDAFRATDDASFQVVITGGIKPQIFWFDARWSALQAAVDAALPGRINKLQGDKDGRLLIFSYGDVDPGRWFVLDTKTSKMWQLAAAMPKIDPQQMRPMETIQYPARDGLPVNAYLTLPANAGDRLPPLIVLIHGGPRWRDRWAWNEEVQLLASRGYAVFQPQFRGSEGFGRRFEVAGYRQWGRAMQDDITDGVKHLIAGKRVDPARICIYGGSYGGYAALWGVITTPELYQCGASFAGVTDLTTLLSHSLLDDSDAASRELDRKMVGDPESDRELLASLSPLRNVSRVTRPLLLVHGEDDARVLPWQSKAMAQALREQGKPVETMWIDAVGHGFAFVGDQVQYYKRLLAFFDKYIGETTAKAELPVSSNTTH